MELAITVYLINFIAFISGYLYLSNGRYSATRATFVTRQTTNQPTREYIYRCYVHVRIHADAVCSQARNVSPK